jgi:HK97 family phage major capsid protein
MSTITTEGLEFEFPELKQTLGAIDEKAKALATVFEEAGSDMDLSKVKSVDGGKDAVLAFIRDTNTELSELGVKRDEQAALARGLKFTKGYDPEQYAHLLEGEGVPSGRPQRSKSFGEMFVESKAGSDLKGQEVEIDFDVSTQLKALFETGAGWAPATVRSPRVVLDAQRPVQLVPLVPQRNTSLSSWTYMEETTFTNNAAETAEGGTKPEAALALTERTANVRKIPVWIPVTDEQLEDVDGIQQYLENRLGFMVMQRLDGQMVAGNGTAPNLRGLLNVVGIQTQAKGTDPTPDAIYKAMTKVRVVGQAIPDIVVLHPYDWQDIRLLRTADGVYIWGNPSEAGPERIWSLPVAQVQAATENTGLVFDSSTTELAWKKGMTIKVSDSHGTYFVENKQAVRAEIRVAWTAYKPDAICSVTGI